MADDVRPRSREKPDRIGRYRITSHVGRGAMGVVYAAYDDAMGRSVAVKVLMSDLEHDPETAMAKPVEERGDFAWGERVPAAGVAAN